MRSPDAAAGVALHCWGGGAPAGPGSSSLVPDEGAARYLIDSLPPLCIRAPTTVVAMRAPSLPSLQAPTRISGQWPCSRLSLRTKCCHRCLDMGPVCRQG